MRPFGRVDTDTCSQFGRISLTRNTTGNFSQVGLSSTPSCVVGKPEVSDTTSGASNSWTFGTAASATVIDSGWPPGRVTGGGVVTAVVVDGRTVAVVVELVGPGPSEVRASATRTP